MSERNMTVPNVDNQKEDLHESMGIANERVAELHDKAMDLLVKHEHIADAIVGVIEMCENDAEVAFSLFAVGATYGKCQASSLIE